MNVASPRIHGRAARWAIVVMAFGAASMSAGAATAERVTIPLACNQGPRGQHFDAGITLPARAERGSVYWVRIDGVSSGKVAHVGLNHIHDMTVDYVLPPGAAYVDGSAQIVPGTGTPNVTPTARLRDRRRVLTLSLPGKVEGGTAYTAPSIRFQLRAVGAPGTAAVVALQQFRLTANVFLLGDVSIACDPSPKPAAIGTTRITAPAGPMPGG